MLHTRYVNILLVIIFLGAISCSTKQQKKSAVQPFAYSNASSLDTLTQVTPPLNIMSAYFQMVIDQSNEKKDTNNPVTVKTYNGSNNQLWKIEKAEGGFIISSFQSDMTLSINKKDSTIQQQPFEGKDFQIWSFIGKGDSLRIQNKATNLFLSLGPNVLFAEPYNESDAQLWRIFTPQDYREMISKCNCRENLKFIQSTMESSYAGFPDKVNQKTKPQYDSLTDVLASQSRNTASVDSCYELIEKYISFFHDKHVGIKNLHPTKTKPQKVYNQINKKREPEISMVNENTLVLTIPSFSDVEKVDNFLLFNFDKLTNSPNLIIDLRNNGGGDDRAWHRLVPYLYSNPIHSKGNEIRASDQLIKWYEFQIKCSQRLSVPPEQRKITSDLLERMKANRGKFVARSLDETSTLNFVTKNPKKVILLINENCGSSCEEFILAAKQSKKVVLMGQNTTGCLDYSNVFTICCPSPVLQLKFATTRSNRLPEYSVDKEGIKPDIYLKYSQDWIKEAVKQFEKMKPFIQL